MAPWEGGERFDVYVTSKLSISQVYKPNLDGCTQFVVYAKHEDYEMSQLRVLSERTFTQRSPLDLHGLPICFGAAPGGTAHQARNWCAAGSS